MQNLQNQVRFSCLVPSSVARPSVTLRMRENITAQTQLIALLTHEFSDSIAEVYTQDAMDGARDQLQACQLEYERTLALFN